MNANDPLASPTSLAEHLRRRELQCRQEREAYSRWLGALTPLRWSMIGASTVLSAVAGATVFAHHAWFGLPWETVAGLCAFGAALLSSLHAAFNCEKYQEDCRHIVHLFHALELSYQTAQIVDPARQALKVDELDTRLEQIISNAATSTPGWCQKWALRKLRATAPAS